MRAKPRDVAAFMQEAMRRNERSANQVAKLAGYQSNSIVSRVSRGLEAVPMDRIEQLADGLGLIEDGERAYWRFLVLLGHCPKEIRDMFWEIQDALETLATKRVGLYERAQSLADRLAELERQRAELLAENKRLKTHHG